MSPPPHQQSVTVSHEYDIDPPKPEKAYLVPEHIFKRIKSRLSNKRSIVPICQNIGSASVGIAGSAFITALTVTNLYCWIIFGLSLITGVLLWIFSIIFNKIESDNNADLNIDLALIEQK